MSRYLSYDQDQLDYQYGSGRMTPEYMAKRREIWGQQSAQARKTIPCELDVIYGTSDRQKLDIFRTKVTDPAPVQVYIHGGYWRKNGKDEMSYVAHGLTKAGFTTVVLGYDLAPLVHIRDQVRQLSLALVWIFKNIARYGGDPSRIHLIGHSAGGHLAAMLLATDFPAIDRQVPANLIKSATCISGIYDLEPIRLTSFLDADLKLTPIDVKDLSPAFQKPKNPDARLSLVVGEFETTEFFRQACIMAQAWRDALGDIRVVNMPGHDHFSVRAALYESCSDTCRLVKEDANSLMSPAVRREPASLP